MTLGLRLRPWTVEPGEITRPKKMFQSNFRHSPKATLLLDFEGKEDVLSHNFARSHCEQDVGLEHAGLRPAEVVFTIEAPKHEGDPTNPGLFKHETDAWMALANPREHNRAHQFRHHAHRKVDDPHKLLVARLGARYPNADLTRAAGRIGVQIDRHASLCRGCPHR